MTITKSKQPELATVPYVQYRLSTYHYSRYDLMATNAFIGQLECDFLGVRKSGFVDEFEIKMSRSDFKADFKKTCSVKVDDSDPWWKTEDVAKHELLQLGKLTPNHFYFVVKKGVATLEDIPEKYGLIEFDDSGSIRTVREASRLHSGKISDTQRLKLAMKLHYRWWDLFRQDMRTKELSS